jgi:hypothetical protein
MHPKRIRLTCIKNYSAPAAARHEEIKREEAREQQVDEKISLTHCRKVSNRRYEKQSSVESYRKRTFTDLKSSVSVLDYSRQFLAYLGRYKKCPFDASFQTDHKPMHINIQFTQ